MKKRIVAALICMALLFTACGTSLFEGSGGGDSQAESDEKAEGEADGKEKDGVEAKASGKKASGKESSGKKTSGKETSEEESTDKKSSGKKSADKGSEDEGSVEIGSAEEESAEGEPAEKESAEGELSKDESAKDEAAKKEAEDREAYDKKIKELAKKQQEEKEKAEKARREFDEEIAGDYVPEGFSPYGNYLLVYDSGYPVKTRLSPAGMTFYWESEEFFFRQAGTLPDMTKNVAHLLYNTQAPMYDPGEEEFPFEEGYVLQISLDNGSYYEVYSSQLDKHGRIFVRDLFESFRVKYGGAF